MTREQVHQEIIQRELALTQENDDLKTVVNERDARIRGQVDDLSRLEKERDELRAKNQNQARQVENLFTLSVNRSSEINLLKESTGAYKDNLEKKDAELSSLRSELEKAKLESVSMEADCAGLRSELAQSREVRDKADGKSFNLEEEMADLRLELAQAKERVKAMENESPGSVLHLAPKSSNSQTLA